MPELRDRSRPGSRGPASPCPTAPPSSGCASRSTPRAVRGTPSGSGRRPPLVHPATGFSVAPALGLAPRLAAELARHLPHDPAAATTAARRLLWPRSARACTGCAGTGCAPCWRCRRTSCRTSSDAFSSPGAADARSSPAATT
ncbi:lycopene cyclase family protein [Pseudonocardia sp. ICBG601]|uniref:lycopene cyclase family protein n=1 Tax=Pseudonocardia sp. ICBG601 TaxID=2846759 RepID=UPI0021F6561B|nr:lycopene cyclase family protein [Pseudonocardia sp. ICBG601]